MDLEPTAQLLRLGLKAGYIDLRGDGPDVDAARATRYRTLRRLGFTPWRDGLWVPDADTVDHVTACRLELERLGDTAYVTGASALYIEQVLRKPPEAVELLRPAHRWLPPSDGRCVHYVRDFEAVPYRTRRGARVTLVVRSLAEYARHAGFTELVRTCADTIRARLCTLDQLEAELARGRFPGCRRLRAAVVALRGELNHSGYERLGRSLLRAAGVVVPSRPLSVLTGTVSVAEVDLPFFEVSYGVEIDGPHHLLPQQAAKDRARDRMLDHDHGITIDRYYWYQLDEEPERFVREVTERLRSRNYPGLGS